MYLKLVTSLASILLVDYFHVKLSIFEVVFPEIRLHVNVGFIKPRSGHKLLTLWSLKSLSEFSRALTSWREILLRKIVVMNILLAVMSVAHRFGIIIDVLLVLSAILLIYIRYSLVRVWNNYRLIDLVLKYGDGKLTIIYNIVVFFIKNLVDISLHILWIQRFMLIWWALLQTYLLIIIFLIVVLIIIPIFYCRDLNKWVLE